jgi:hypothetical protein
LWLANVRDDSVSFGEATNVAIAFSKTNEIADAFQEGQGPTAHIMPIMPIIAGTVYKLFGVKTVASAAVLTTWSLLVTLGSYLLFFRAFGRLGVPLTARLLAFGFLAAVPLNMSLEVIAFRVWEGGLAVLMGAFCLDQLLRLDAAPEVRRRDIIAMGLLAAACLFVSPPTGIAAYYGGLLLMIRKVDRRRWPGVIAIVTLATVVVLTPWLVRNMNVMGRPILLRDNLGLEAAQANHSAALSDGDPRIVFRERHTEIHPYGGHREAYAKMQAAGGEAAYAEMLAAETKDWIRSNPAGFVRLSLRHLGEMLFPPAWYWTMFGSGSRGTFVKLALNWAVTLLALAGIAWGYRRTGTRYLYVAFFALLPLIPYMLVQPTLRYRYLILSLFVFIAADFLARLWARLSKPPPEAALAG